MSSRSRPRSVVANVVLAVEPWRVVRAFLYAANHNRCDPFRPHSTAFLFPSSCASTPQSLPSICSRTWLLAAQISRSGKFHHSLSPPGASIESIRLLSLSRRLIRGWAMPSAHPGNALATVRQLSYSASQQDGVSAELEDSVRFAGSRLTQMAGILTRLPQDVVATAIVNFTRFWIGQDGGSIKEHAVKDVSAASLYLAAKLSPYPKSPRSILNVYAYLEVTASTLDFSTSKLNQPNPETYYLSESTYQARRVELMKVEALLLRTLGFQTQMTLPHNLSVNYLQTLEVFSNPAGAEVAKQTFAHLNNALLSPQLLYLTHQPSSLATAAIYLSAREIGVKLPGENWWEVFDTDREELGFLVVALRSMEGFAREQKSKWADRRVPMTPSEVQQELKRQD